MVFDVVERLMERFVLSRGNYSKAGKTAAKVESICSGKLNLVLNMLSVNTNLFLQ